MSESPRVKAPSPAEIARRAYERATGVAFEYAATHTNITPAALREALEAAKESQLDALRSEVVNPGPIPSRFK